jgi:hypothetical protein
LIQISKSDVSLSVFELFRNGDSSAAEIAIETITSQVLNTRRHSRRLSSASNTGYSKHRSAGLDWEKLKQKLNVNCRVDSEPRLLISTRMKMANLEPIIVENDSLIRWFSECFKDCDASQSTLATSLILHISRLQKLRYTSHNSTILPLSLSEAATTTSKKITDFFSVRKLSCSPIPEPISESSSSKLLKRKSIDITSSTDSRMLPSVSLTQPNQSISHKNSDSVSLEILNTRIDAYGKKEYLVRWDSGKGQTSPDPTLSETLISHLPETALETVYNIYNSTASTSVSWVSSAIVDAAYPTLPRPSSLNVLKCLDKRIFAVPSSPVSAFSSVPVVKRFESPETPEKNLRVSSYDGFDSSGDEQESYSPKRKVPGFDPPAAPRKKKHYFDIHDAAMRIRPGSPTDFVKAPR